MPPPVPVTAPQDESEPHLTADPDQAPALPDPALDVRALDAAYWVPDPGPQFVRGVMISSLDGAAALDGRAGGLGNATDARLFAVMRAQSDVLLVGAATVRAEKYGGDRPTAELTAVRSAHGLGVAPVLAVVSGRLDLDPSGPIFTDTLTRPIVLTTSSADRRRRAELEPLADVVTCGADRVDMNLALDALADRGLRRVSCEGGPSVLAQVAATGRMDEISLTLAPLLTGGDAPRITHGPPITPPQHWSLMHLLNADDLLFLRYRRHPDPS